MTRSQRSVVKLVGDLSAEPGGGRRLPRRRRWAVLSAVILALAVAACGDKLATLPTRLDPAKVVVQDGDSIHYGATDVRLMGIDAPEIASGRFVGAQEPYGTQAKHHLESILKGAQVIELRLATVVDKYHRQLGYLVVDDKNVSAEMVRGGFAYENVSHFGFQGFTVEATEVAEAAKAHGPPAFEAPYLFRRRARKDGQGAK